MKTFWHITSPNNLLKILTEGITLNKGKIFLFDNKKFALNIAIDQCGLTTEYALFQIKGIDESRLQPDNVAEYTAGAQWIYDRPISAAELNLIGCYKVR